MARSQIFNVHGNSYRQITTENHRIHDRNNSQFYTFHAASNITKIHVRELYTLFNINLQHKSCNFGIKSDF